MDEQKLGGNAGVETGSTASPATEATPSEQKVEVIGGTANPAAQPMVSTTQIEAAEAVAKAEEEKKKKSKKGLIIGLVIGFFVIAGGVVGVLFALGVFNPADPVTVAMTKLMEGGRPDTLSMSGTVDFVPAEKTFFSKLSVDFKTAIKTNTFINSADATVKADTVMGDVELSLSEIYASPNEIFLKLKGTEDLSRIIETLTYSSTEYEEGDDDDDTDVVDCAGSEDSTDCLSYSATTETVKSTTSLDSTSSMIAGMVAEVVTELEDKWIRIPLDEAKSSDLFNFSANQSLTCLMEFSDSMSKKGNKLGELYKKSPFVSSTTENMSVAKKTNPIYKLVFDAENMNQFNSALVSEGLLDEYAKCNGASGVDDVEKVADEALKKLPDIYVEIDGQSRFTRFYTTVSGNDGTKATVDLELGYPNTIDVAEPTEYSDLQYIITKLMTSKMMER